MHRKMRRPMTGDYDGWCKQCLKRIYYAREKASKAEKSHHGEHLRPYRCPSNLNVWHIGHLPEQQITQGVQPEMAPPASRARKRKSLRQSFAERRLREAEARFTALVDRAKNRGTSPTPSESDS